MFFYRLLTVLALIIVGSGASFAVSPDSAWIVGPINAKSAQGISYCSMRNSYPGGYSLVFARDVNGDNSVAIDFGKKQLTPGAQYALLLEVGVAERKMTAVAATNAVLLAKTGKDPEFYDFLGKQSLLQATIQGASLTFGLTGTADALTALEECVVALAQGKSFNHENVSAAIEGAGGKEKDIKLSTQVNDKLIKEELEKLKAENRRLSLENQNITAKLIEKEATTADSSQIQKRKPAKKPVVSVKKKKEPAIFVSPEEPAVTPVDVADEGLEKMLTSAGISAELQAGSYIWREATVNGIAEEASLPAGATVSQSVAGYIDQARLRCEGDFAYKLGAVERIAGGREVIQGEMACMTGANDVAAAMIFIAQGDRMFALTVEAGTEMVNAALTRRDDIFKRIR